MKIVILSPEHQWVNHIARPSGWSTTHHPRHCTYCPTQRDKLSSLVVLHLSGSHQGNRSSSLSKNDDVIKWKHFPRYCPFVRGIHRSRGVLMFSLICPWISGWVNNREVGDLRRRRAHYDANVLDRHLCERTNPTDRKKILAADATFPWCDMHMTNYDPCNTCVTLDSACLVLMAWCPFNSLTHWGRVTHICVSKLTIIGSDNGLSPGRRQAIICTNAGILLIRTLGTNFSEILGEIHSFSFSKMHLKMSFAKWRLFGLGLNELTHLQQSRRRRSDAGYQDCQMYCWGKIVTRDLLHKKKVYTLHSD